MNGFLGTQANFGADLSLVVSAALLVIAFIGYRHARRKNYKGHATLMAWAALLNWVPIMVVMIPVFLKVISGQLTLTSEPFSAMPIFHGILGLATQILLTYTVVRMQWAYKWPPRRTRWLMRISLILWVLTELGGIFLYLASYVL